MFLKTLQREMEMLFMKKYSGVLLLFIVQNIYAMELDPFDRCIEYDGKCQLVAKYLYKYPKGENKNEAWQIERFLEDTISECVTILPLLVKKYKNILATKDAEEYLHAIYKEELSQDLRQKIFTQALSYSAEDYYVAHNSLQFLEKYQPWGLPRYNSSTIKNFYKPYFLAEIHEEDVCMHFSGLDDNVPKGTRLNSTVKLVNTAGQLVNRYSVGYDCEVKFIRKLISFLDKKNERVNNFKIMFNHYIEQLSQMNEEDGVNMFIVLLKQFKDLTKHIVYLYTGRDRLT